MAAVLAQMHNNAIYASTLTKEGSKYRLRFKAPPYLPDTGNMVDIYP
jgi:hypothetical protein